MKSEKNFPQHIAIIMDGNGRWAKKRLMPRNFGHNEGVKNIDRIANAVFEKGVKYLTLFAFSTENWNRPAGEVDSLLKLLKKYLKDNIQKLIEKQIALRIYGDLSKLDNETRTLIEEAVEKTGEFAGHVLGICFNYGGRDEIVNAVNKLIAAGKPVDEKTFSDSLYTAGVPDPDIIIRTGGQRRISNFLLYQMAYAEMFFTDTLWPDFSEKDIDKIIDKFLQTERRYGSIEE